MSLQFQNWKNSLMKRCAGHTHGLFAYAVVSFVSFVIVHMFSKYSVQYNYGSGWSLVKI